MDVRYEVGPFRLDPARRRLHNGDVPVALTPKVFELLLAFVEHPGALLSKDELLQMLWPDTAVEENNLTHCIAKLRRALGDDIRARRFIVTVPGQGYRFVAAVRAISVAHGAGRPERPEGAAPGHARVSRLLVLPLRILRAGSEDDFLAFSVPDAIASSLCGLESLIVRSSATAARFAGEPPDLEAIATGADVDAVLRGTLLHGGDDVRISAQLVHVPDGTVLWSGMAQARRGDVFKLQDSLTRRIVDALAVQLTARDRQLLRRDVPASGHAYELYLRANQLGYDAQHLHAARDLYLQSVAEDPGYAPAWARLGRVYRVIGKYEGDGLAQSMVLGEGAFTRALELNPDLPLAHGLYAYLEADLGRAQDAVMRLLRQAGTANDSELLAGLVHTCRYCGLLDESVAAHERARRVDPTVRTSVAQTHWARRDYQRAVDADVDSPSYVSILSVDGMGRTSEAIVLANEALRRSTASRTSRVFLSAWRAALEGDRQSARAGVERTMRVGFPDPEAIYRFGWMLARVREDDFALELLRRAVTGGFACPLHMSADPWFDPLREGRAFGEILSLARDRQTTARAAFVALRGDELIQVGATGAAIARG
jgi:DNA-binding winged helix-turn-helix (wHTH) protein/tetratricopeptide (TPR) repeat protein